jgi:hypothetical protein
VLFNECQTISTVSNEKFSKIKAIDCLINVIELFNNNDSSQLESLIFDNMNYKVIDMDKLEEKFSHFYSRNKRKSMDFAFVINFNNQFFTVILELRLNYINVSNLNLNSLKEKDKTSTRQSRLFGFPIHNERYFIFKNGIKQQAINRLNRMNPRCPNNYKVKTPQELYSDFF